MKKISLTIVSVFLISTIALAIGSTDRTWKFDTWTTDTTDGDLTITPNGTGILKTDNLGFDGNTISSTDTDGDIELTPDGAGGVNIDSEVGINKDAGTNALTVRQTANSTDGGFHLYDNQDNDYWKHSAFDNGFYAITKNGLTTYSMGITNTGNVAFGSLNAGSNTVLISKPTDQVQLSVKGHSAQSSNIFEIENSGGTDLVTVDNNGLLTSVGLTSSDPLTLSHESTPSNPSAGTVKVYPKSDNKMYVLDSSGSESELGSGAGGAGAHHNFAQLNGTNWDAELGDETDWSVLWNGTPGTLDAVDSGTTAPKFGTYSMSIDFAESGDVVSFDMGDPLTVGETGNCIASFYYKGFDTNATARVYDLDNTAYVSESTTLTASTDWTRNEELTFVCVGGVEYHLRFLGGGDAAVGYVDNVWVGENYLVGDVNPQDVFSANVSSSDVVSGENQDWIDGDCANTAAGLSTCTFVTGIFNEAPNCTASSKTRAYFTAIHSVSATEVAIATDLHDGVDTDQPFTVQCQKTGSDAPQQAVAMDQTPGAWSGYHDADCSLSTTSTSYALPTGDATCTFAERTNTNFGTVSSLADGTGNQSGITFTPKKTGSYWVCAFPTVSGSTSSTQELQLWDGTTTISTGSHADGSSGIRDTVSLCGLYNVTAIEEKTLSVRIATTAGTGTINGNISETIEWSIIQIASGMNAALVKFGLTQSDGTNTWVINSAIIEYSGSTPSVTTESGDWISGVAANSTGDSTITITSGIYSSAPICVCSGYSTSTDSCSIDTTTTPSATTMRVQIVNPAGTVADRGYTINCMGPR